jgi:hypothetical protein
MDRLFSQKNVWNEIILNYLEPRDVQNLMLSSRNIMKSVSNFHKSRAKYFQNDDPLDYIDAKNLDAIVFWLNYSSPHHIHTIHRFLVRGPVNFCKRVVSKMENQSQIDNMLEMAYKNKRSSVVAFLSMKRTDQKIERLITALVFNTDMRKKIDQLKSKPKYLALLQYHAMRHLNYHVFFYIENILAEGKCKFSEKFANKMLYRFFKQTRISPINWRKITHIRLQLGQNKAQFIRQQTPRVSTFFIKRFLQHIGSPTTELVYNLVWFTMGNYLECSHDEIFQVQNMTKQLMDEMFQVPGYRGDILQLANQYGITRLKELINVQEDHGLTFITNLYGANTPILEHYLYDFLFETPCPELLDYLMRNFSTESCFSLNQLYEKYENVAYPHKTIQGVQNSQAFIFLYFYKGINIDLEYINFLESLPDNDQKTRIQNIIKRVPQQ